MSCPTARLPVLVILPGFSRNRKPTGIFTVNKGGAWGLLALNSNPLSKMKLSAVLAEKEPATSKRALGPNITPLGLAKNKFALPKTPKVPPMLELLLPVTRLRILAIPDGLEK